MQTYGGGLWHTWFDRDLTVAGRMMIREEKDGSLSYSHRLVRIQEPIMRIPTLAIHLDRYLSQDTVVNCFWDILCLHLDFVEHTYILLSRGVNSDGFKVNTHSHLVPVLATSIKVNI